MVFFFEVYPKASKHFLRSHVIVPTISSRRPDKGAYVCCICDVCTSVSKLRVCIGHTPLIISPIFYTPSGLPHMRNEPPQACVCMWVLTIICHAETRAYTFTDAHGHVMLTQLIVYFEFYLFVYFLCSVCVHSLSVCTRVCMRALVHVRVRVHLRMHVHACACACACGVRAGVHAQCACVSVLYSCM